MTPATPSGFLDQGVRRGPIRRLFEGRNRVDEFRVQATARTRQMLKCFGGPAAVNGLRLIIVPSPRTPHLYMRELSAKSIIRRTECILPPAVTHVNVPDLVVPWQ